MTIDRKTFLTGAAGLTLPRDPLAAAPRQPEDVLDLWQRETDAVTAQTYARYMRDGRPCGFASLEKLERAFENAVTEARAAKIGVVPGVWSIYNMGYLVKTRESLFAIDLVHRRGLELARELDFLLVTHNHGDHCDQRLYRDLNRAHRTVVSNFLDNYGACDRRQNRVGGYTRAEKVFRFKDVEVRTSLVDHNRYLIDYTTAFEIRVGDWTMYHTGDCGRDGKLRTVWGPPDLWTFFPGCGVNVKKAVERVRPKKLVFGHLWELGHTTGRLTTPLIRAAHKKAVSAGRTPHVALWGERIS